MFVTIYNNNDQPVRRAKTNKILELTSAPALKHGVLVQVQPLLSLAYTAIFITQCDDDDDDCDYNYELCDSNCNGRFNLYISNDDVGKWRLGCLPAA